MLKKLEAMNYLKRSRSQSDERTVAIQLTYPGKYLQAKVPELLNPLENFFSEADNPELFTLNHSLQSLLERIESSER